MQQTPHRCPCCSQPLGISWDMWGQFYVCRDCGFTAEDDEELKPPGASEPLEPLQSPPLLTTAIHSYRMWQATEGR